MLSLPHVVTPKLSPDMARVPWGAEYSPVEHCWFELYTQCLDHLWKGQCMQHEVGVLLGVCPSAPPRHGWHDSQHLTASLRTPGPRLNFHGSPGDLGVPEAGWSPGPNAGLQETVVAVATAELLG